MSKTNTPLLANATKPKVKEVLAVIECGMQQVREDIKMTEILKRDIFNRDKQTGQTILTKQLDKLFKSGNEDEVKRAKVWVKTRLQTIVKVKSVQQLLLDGKHQEQSLTIKKVKSTMIGDMKKYISRFDENDLGCFRVVIERKVTEQKTFEEELIKLMDKHEKVVEDLIPIIESQGIDFAKVA